MARTLSSQTEAVAEPAAALLRRIEWTVLKRLDGLLQGDHRTLMRGAGLDLADLREYQPSDDVRHIDWNVTARLGLPHVRQFMEDRDMNAWFLLDLSPSVDFGSSTQTKRRLSREFVAVLGRLLMRHGNRVGALLYGGGHNRVLPARSGRQHLLEILHAMAPPYAPPPDGDTTRLHELLAAASPMLRRRSAVFVVSDFISQPGWHAALGRLVLGHDVVAVRLLDPLELELPDLGLLTLRDAETGEHLVVDTHDAGFRRRFARIAAQREAELREALAQAGVDTLELSTDDDLVEALVRFVDLRRRRQHLHNGSSPPRHLHAA
jgi:uncharacterized protein (DUF58 family)